MIEQVLNRDFVLAQLDRVAAYAEGHATDLPGIAEILGAAATAERARSSGQRCGLTPGAQARRGSVPALDDVAYFSRSPIVSLLQSALDRYVEEAGLATTDLVRESDGGRRGRRAPPAVTERSLAHIERATQPDGRRTFGRFQKADVGWLSTAMALGLRQVKGRHPFNPVPGGPVTIANKARLILLGDWGTGLPRARAVARRARELVDDGLANGLDQHVVHLGDVYYSGWDWEYDKRFFAYWPVAAVDADRVSSWAIAGNHDLYSGGHGYYDHLLGDRRFRGQERSSFFSLRNDDWEVLGLDTASEEGGLADPQAEWVRERAAASGRNLLLLSHHQLASAYQKVSPALAAKLREPLGSGRVRAWFWGHEHRCMLFGPGAGVNAGRCIGHGGVPVHMWRDANEPCPLPATYEYRARRWEGVEPWAMFGFAVLDFDGPRIRVRYIDEDGTVHLVEEIS